MKTRNKHQTKREYLAETIFNGAKALYEFFEELTNNKSVSSSDLSYKLSKKHELTSNQIDFLKKVAIRASTAQEAISYLEDKFGIDEKGKFEDAQGLHSFLCKPEKSIENINAFSHNVSIGFTTPNWDHYIEETRKKNGKIGFAHSFSFDQLKLPGTLSRLKNGEKTDLEIICFSMPDLEYLDLKKEKKEREMTPNAEDKILRMIFGDIYRKPIDKQNEIKRHELRHIFDRIMNCRNNPYRELIADLYAIKEEERGINRLNTSGLDRDLKRDGEGLLEFRNNLIKYWENKLTEYKENKDEYSNSTRERLIEIAEKSILRNERKDQKRNNEIETISKMINMIPKRDYPLISYVISGVHNNEYGRVANCLKLIAENYPGEKR